MHLRTRNGLLALAVIAALFSFAPAALAAHGNGRGHGRGHDKEYSGRGSYRGGGYTTQRWRTPQRGYAQRPTYDRHTRIRANVRVYGGSGGYYGGGYGAYSGRPAYVACRPRYVTYRPQRIVIVRPAPYVRIGGVFGSVGISAVFGPRRHYSSYDYGCNFCDAHFSSYGAYEDHVHSCGYRPSDVQIQCRNWDDEGYNDYRSSDGYEDDPGYRANDGYDDDQGDDREGYDDGN